MKNKLTSNILNQLIKEVLQEKTGKDLKKVKISAKDNEIDTKDKINKNLKPSPPAYDRVDKGNYEDALKWIRSQDDNPDDISAYDVQVGSNYDNHEDNNIEKVAFALGQNDTFKDAIDDYSKTFNEDREKWEKNPKDRTDPSKWKTRYFKDLAHEFKYHKQKTSPSSPITAAASSLPELQALRVFAIFLTKTGSEILEIINDPYRTIMVNIKNMPNYLYTMENSSFVREAIRTEFPAVSKKINFILKALAKTEQRGETIELSDYKGYFEKIKNNAALAPKITDDDLKKFLDKYDIEKLKTADPDIFDLKGLKDKKIPIGGDPMGITLNRNLEKVLTDFGVTDVEKSLEDLQTIIATNFTGVSMKRKGSDGSDENIDIKKLIGLNERVDTTKYLDIGDLEELLGTSEEYLQTNSKQIEQALRKSYRQIYDDSTKSESEKKGQLKIIKILLDAVEYYGSGRQIRTTSGPEVGLRHGTARASGISRSLKEVQDIFANMSEITADSATGLVNKIQQFSEFLTDINLKKFDNTASKVSLFCKFVGLEMLHDILFEIGEAGAKGTIFEAWLAAFCGGVQIGGERGAGDFTVGTVEGSAKLVNEMKFSQSTKGLMSDIKKVGDKKEFLYVVALKTSRSETGVKITATEEKRILSVDVYMFSVHIEGIEKDGKLLKSAAGDHIYATPIGSNEKLSSSRGTKSTQTAFNFSDFSRQAFITSLDFSFIEKKEFLDVSGDILSQIDTDINRAYTTMTQLKNNVTRWVSNKDLVAANETVQNEKDLSESLANLRINTDFQASELSENKKKSKKDLDNLIKEVILKRLLK